MMNPDNIKEPYKLRIITIVGTRPQFIKAAMVSRAIEQYNLEHPNRVINEIIVHTGQHYDHNMSQVFFNELEIPEPDFHLEVGSGSHGLMTGKMLVKIEDVLHKEQPDWVVVYGDTNSTLAGALAAAKLHIPVAHVEAGLRSFNKQMPEEINRLLTDHVSHLLFAPTDTAVSNLAAESIVHGVAKSGDVMLDAFLLHKSIAADKSGILDDLGVERGNYCLATVHRAENTDNLSRLTGIFRALDIIGSKNHQVILPLHPRTHKTLADKEIDLHSLSGVRIIEPVSYLDMIQLESNSKIIFTDSGGVQKEACFAGIPCVTLRDETEWVETVESGINFLAGSDVDGTVVAFNRALAADMKTTNGIYGDGQAAEKIVELLISFTYNI